MANNSPWSVKGVAPEAREAAKIAARRQGVNVGRWLTQTILAAASEELRSKRGEDSQQKQPGTGASFSFAGEPSKVPEAANQAPEAQPPAPQQQQQQQPPQQQQVQQMQQQQQQQMQQPQQQQQQPPQYPPNYAAPPVSSGPPALTPEAVLASIQKLASRIEESEQRTADVLKPIADKVGDLSVQIEDIKTKSGGNSAPVERAMMRLSERLDRMEEPGKGTGSRPSKTSSSSGVMSRLFGRD
jgi:hypothetical protein